MTDRSRDFTGLSVAIRGHGIRAEAGARVAQPTAAYRLGGSGLAAGPGFGCNRRGWLISTDAAGQSRAALRP